MCLGVSHICGGGSMRGEGRSSANRPPTNRSAGRQPPAGGGCPPQCVGATMAGKVARRPANQGVRAYHQAGRPTR
eukprot:327555-Chlamydomonas_euryale.AAC.1